METDLVAPVDRADEYNRHTPLRSEFSTNLRHFKTDLRAGDEAPDFDLPTTDGQRVRLSQFRGKKHTLLEFGSIT